MCKTKLKTNIGGEEGQVAVAATAEGRRTLLNVSLQWTFEEGVG